MAYLGSADWILKQSKRYPLLTAKEEITLARQVHDWLALGDVAKPTPKQRSIIRKGQRARERFFLCNIRLVVDCAGKYSNISSTLTLEDLIQEGLLGLDSAIRKFDPTLGYKFSTYSYWWIRQSMTRSINKFSRIIHLPTGANDVVRKATDYMKAYKSEWGKLPPTELVAQACNVGPDTLINYMVHNASMLSLDQQVKNNPDRSTYLELIADVGDNGPQVTEMDFYGDLLIKAINSLPEDHKRIVTDRYFHGDKRPKTYHAIGEELHLSREMVRRMHDQALEKLQVKLDDLVGQGCTQALRSAA